MKRYLLVFVAIGFVLACAAVAMADMTPGTGIKNTYHDLSATGTGGIAIGQSAETRICVFCHTPHFGAKEGVDAVGAGTYIKYFPLWNNDLSTVTTYQTYTNGTDLPDNLARQFNALLDPNYVNGPGGVSRLCLSCHDGSVALNAYGNMDNGQNPTKGAGGITINNVLYGGVAGGAKIGGPAGAGTYNDLRNHHPVGFNYATVQTVDTGLFDASTPLLGGTGLTIQDVLWNGNIECTSCHSVHNKGNEGFKFLWVDDNTESQLCLSCHDK